MKKIVTALILVICFVGVAVAAFNVGRSQGFKTGYDYVIQNQYISYDEVSHERVIFLDRCTYVYDQLNNVERFEWEEGEH